MAENPPGSKLLRRVAKASGLAVDNEDGTSRRPTAAECREWYDNRIEAPQKQGHQGYRFGGSQVEAMRVV